MNLQLEGKSALVSGSTAGIGLAIATALAKEGVSVIVNGRTQKRVDQAIRASGAAHGIAADLGTETGTRAVIERFPAVDIRPTDRRCAPTAASCVRLLEGLA